MREILFRGKFDNGSGWINWIEGDLIHYDKNDYRIIDQNRRYWDILHDGVKVDKKTIGQYTGLKDKNGVKIFESDICVNSDKDNYPRPLSVEWIEEFACFAFVDKGDFNNMYFYQKNHMENVAVVGNVYDNKDLIK